jgi:hypothetical protein
MNPKTKTQPGMLVDELWNWILFPPKKTILFSKLEKEMGWSKKRTQQEHWMGWVRDILERLSYYPRIKRKGPNTTAECVYNQIKSAPMLLWLGESAGVPQKIVASAIVAFRHAKPDGSSKCGAIRKVMPWALVEAAYIK